MTGFNITGLPLTLTGINSSSCALSYGLFIDLLTQFPATVTKQEGRMAT
jgi:hypothetical protein